MTKIFTCFLLFALFAFGCTPNKRSIENYESDRLKIIQIDEGVFQHTSYLEINEYGKFPCNGMVYLREDEAIVFDTPIDNEASSELISWLGDRTIKGVVVTHFHIDCLGGLEKFQSEGIKSYATPKTIRLAKEHGEKFLPQIPLSNQHEFRIGSQSVFTKYFGEGHTKDNIVGYVPSTNSLFGGCLIKELDASKGNLADANTEDWSETVSKIKNEYPNLVNVIPGHGKSGGPELLDYTIDLFQVKE